MKSSEELLSGQDKTKIGFIGCGAMGSAIALGLVNAKKIAAENIFIYSRNKEKAAELSNAGFSLVNDIKDLHQVNKLVIAVKPKDMGAALKALKGLPRDILLISVAAGIKIENLEASFPENPIARVMPNTPTQIGKGVSVISVNNKVSEEKIESVSKIFRTLGNILVLPESNMDAVTAVSGSGPAYVFLMIEAMAEAGVKVGLSSEVAKELALDTVYGAGALAKASDVDASELRKRVTSPGGTTEAALNSFKDNNFNEIVAKAIGAAVKRSVELSK